MGLWHIGNVPCKLRPKTLQLSQYFKHRTVILRPWAEIPGPCHFLLTLEQALTEQEIARQALQNMLPGASSQGRANLQS